MGSTPPAPALGTVSLPAADAGVRTDPQVTVVVATYQGAERIGTALGSLVDQTLLPEEYEVLVVQNGPECATPDVVDQVRRAHPRHRIRLIETRQPGIGHARNLGIDAARGAWVTFVDDDDWVTPGYLAALLDGAAPGVVPMAYLAEVPDGTAPGDVEPDLRNYVSDRILPMAGRTVSPDRASVALSPNVAKLVPTTVARAVRYDESLASGEDFLFWLGVYARTGFDLFITPREAGAVYVRSVRADSNSRRAMSYDFSVSQRLDCIERLAAFPAGQEPLEKLVRWMIAAQTEHVARYLTTHPDEEARVRADAEERGITARIPWRQVNEGKARDLAILYLFAPFLDTSALVAGRRLRERGVLTDVVSQDLSGIRQRDPSSWLVSMEYLDQLRMIEGRASFINWDAIRTFVEGALAEVDALQAEKGPYRTLYSRAMAPASHFAAAIVKLRNPDIVWTAEFSDPMMINAAGEVRVGDIGDDWLTRELEDGFRAAGFEQPTTRESFAWSELVAYALADEILFTNANQQEFMLGYTRERPYAERAATISTSRHHPTLPERFYHLSPIDYPLDEDVVHVGYFGVFYSTRGLAEAISAVEQLSTSERRRIRLHVFTDKPAAVDLDVLHRGLNDVVVVRPYVPFLQFLNLTKKFDVLLVNDYTTATHDAHVINPYLPSKISDYHGSGTPVWTICEPGSVMSTMPAAYTSLLGDVPGAVDVVRKILADGPRTRSGATASA